ncbi:MAG: hypothetical protein HFH41_04120 [Lachnospiraceae bacterium]|nr:hypothetical protein [Lachnospiraceae bacterium]
MYDEKDFDTILKNMRERVDGDISTEEGTLMHFALAPAAAEIEEVYNNLEAADLNGSALTCDREHLILFGKENNIPIKTATNAKWLAEFNLDFEIGERFEAGDLTYINIEKAEERKYFLECETAGAEGNVKPEEELLPIEFIEGYEKGELLELMEAAMDDEDTEVYRNRYLMERKQEYSMNGNRAAYRKYVKGLVGVGGVKLERVKKDHRRIKIYVLSSFWKKPADEVISEIQEKVDPKECQGDGQGMAPFWHVVDIYPVEEKIIDIQAEFELTEGISFAAVQQDIENAVDDYFISLNKTWEDTGRNGLVVRTLKLAEAMAEVTGVVDIRNLRLNESEDNLFLEKNEISAKGEIKNVNRVSAEGDGADPGDQGDLQSGTAGN